MERKEEGEKHPVVSESAGKKMMRHPRVFMDLSIDGRPAKRMVIKLFADVMPKTAENFRALCTGENGIGKVTGKPLHYKGSVFHAFCPHLGAEGGGLSKPHGIGGGESIYGGPFPAERNPNGRSGRGVLMTVSEGSNTTGSLFLLCFKHSSLLEGNNDAFGRVIKGLETVSQLEKLESHALVEITRCGEVFDKPQTRSREDPLAALWNRWLSTPSSNPDVPNIDRATLTQVCRRLRAKKPPPSSPDQMSVSHADISESNQLVDGLSNESEKPSSSNSDKMLESNADISGSNQHVDGLSNESEKPSSSNSDKMWESNADISTLVRAVEELSNNLLVKKRSDDAIKFRRGARIRSARTRGVRISKKSGSSIPEVENIMVMVESDKELGNGNQRFQHDPIMSTVDVRKSNVMAKLKGDLPLIAALILVGVVIFRSR